MNRITKNWKLTNPPSPPEKSPHPPFIKGGLGGIKDWGMGGLLLLCLTVALMIALPAWASTINLPRTGQTTSYAAGDDGAFQAGVAWPDPRFTDNGDQTVTDNLTGLIWTKDAGTPTVGSCTGGTKTWQDALSYVTCLNSNNYLGHNDWRLPQRNEIESLIDASKYNSALPAGHPFTNVQSFVYWSSSTRAIYTGYAWYVGMYYGVVSVVNKSNDYYVWPVRAGQSGAFGNSYIWKTGQTSCYDEAGNVIHG